MAEQNTTRQRNEGQQLHGGTEGTGDDRLLGPGNADPGTPGIATPSGDAHVEPVSRAVPRTNPVSELRDPDAPKLASGKSARDILSYLDGVHFPAEKEEIIRTARRNKAPSDIVAALSELPSTDYQIAEDLISDYPHLIEHDDDQHVRMV